MPTMGIPVPDFRAIGPAGATEPAGTAGLAGSRDPADGTGIDEAEDTRCSLRGTAKFWVQPRWDMRSAAQPRHGGNDGNEAWHQALGVPKLTMTKKGSQDCGLTTAARQVTSSQTVK